jgi:hypothetical protein
VDEKLLQNSSPQPGQSHRDRQRYQLRERDKESRANCAPAIFAF